MIQSDGHRRFERVSANGHPYAVWGSARVPRIDESLLNCVVYLYPSKAAAQKGEQAGGSGFLFGFMDGSAPHAKYLYAVTNRHVIEGGDTFIRLNTKDDKTDVLPTSVADWTFNPRGYDVAVCRVELADQHAFGFLAVEDCVTEDEAQAVGVGPGDEVIMVGRFITHEGKQQNTPVVRHGHIAMMAHEPVVVQQGATPQYLALLELHSVSGFSGSPVLVYIPPWSFRPDGKPLGEATNGREFCKLIGIDCGHADEYRPVKTTKGGGLKDSGHLHTSVNQGMAWMIPADFIVETLNVPKLLNLREKLDAEERNRVPKTAISLDSAKRPRPGPEPEMLKLDGPFEDRIRESFAAPRPRKSGKKKR